MAKKFREIRDEATKEEIERARRLLNAKIKTVEHIGSRRKFKALVYDD